MIEPSMTVFVSDVGMVGLPDRIAAALAKVPRRKNRHYFDRRFSLGKDAEAWSEMVNHLAVAKWIEGSELSPEEIPEL